VGEKRDSNNQKQKDGAMCRVRGNSSLREEALTGLVRGGWGAGYERWRGKTRGCMPADRRNLEKMIKQTTGGGREGVSLL